MKKIFSRLLIGIIVVVIAVPVFIFGKKGAAFLSAKTQDVRYLHNKIELSKVKINDQSLYNPRASLSVVVNNKGERDIYSLILHIEYFDKENYKIKDVKINVLRDYFSTIKQQSEKSFRIYLGLEEYPYGKEVANHKIIKSSCVTLEGLKQ